MTRFHDNETLCLCSPLSNSSFSFFPSFQLGQWWSSWYSCTFTYSVAFGPSTPSGGTLAASTSRGLALTGPYPETPAQRSRREGEATPSQHYVEGTLLLQQQRAQQDQAMINRFFQSCNEEAVAQQQGLLDAITFDTNTYKAS